MPKACLVFFDWNLPAAGRFVICTFWNFNASRACPEDFYYLVFEMTEFILNNELIRTKVHPGITLLDFIRDTKSLKGTKIGCREGDCGACTVLVGRTKGGKLHYENITSCIFPLGNANGKHIVTIEGINLIDKLNLAQQAMTDNFATQCGFCTPGFVVSMTGYAINKNELTQATCNDAISGNIRPE